MTKLDIFVVLDAVSLLLSDFADDILLSVSVVLRNNCVENPMLCDAEYDVSFWTRLGVFDFEDTFRHSVLVLTTQEIFSMAI